MNNNNEQRLEELEEVLQRTLNKVQGLENRKMELPEIKFPDYVPHFNELKESIARHNLAYPAMQIQAQILELKKRLASLPEVIPVRHYHHFDKKSKGFIISATVLLLTCAISIGTSISLWKENRFRNENSIKFRMVWQNYPGIAHWADTTYHRDPEAMKQITEKLEAEQLEIALAQATTKKKELEMKEAKSKENKLQKKIIQ